jgi:hypothetical protein
VSVGVSPALASNPLAQMPPTAVQDLIGSMSRLATKAQDLAIAGAAAENPRDVQFLTTASIKRLDDDLRTVHANAVSAAEDAKDTEGWMRWVRNDNEKNIVELKIMTRTLLEILTPMLDDAQKAKVRSLPLFPPHLAHCKSTDLMCHAQIAEAKAEVKAMRDQMDRGYLGKVTPTAKGQENGGEDSE